METPIARIALVTPHPWNVPHPVNDHVLELATGLELELGGTPAPRTVILAPSTKPRDLRITRRALRDLARGGNPQEVLAREELQVVGSDGATSLCVLSIGLPLSLGRASVAMRAGLKVVYEHFAPDVVHVHDPLEPFGRSALVMWSGLSIGTVHEIHAKSKRALSDIDLLLTPQHELREELAELTGFDPSAIGIVNTLVKPRIARSVNAKSIVVLRGTDDDALTPRAIRELRTTTAAHPDLDVVLLSRWHQHHRPTTPRWLKGRLRTVTATTRREADATLASAVAVIAPIPSTHMRSIAEAQALVGNAVVFWDGDSPLDVEVEKALTAPSTSTLTATEHSIASDLLTAASGLIAKRHSTEAPPRLPATRSCMIDLHMHTNHSWDCATDPEALLWAAREVGLTAIAVTDHNEISGALICAELADEYGIQVIVGEEIMTSQGEVIGLFLNERIEPGQSWSDTLRLIREQDGLVYVPHPFDRLHTIPDAATLRATVDEIDALETYNSRLAFEQYNRDAARFARKYNLAEGAGSDAHVVQGLGTAAVHMPAWDDPASFLAALRQGEIVKRPKSYVYLQGLKFLQTRGKKTDRSD